MQCGPGGLPPNEFHMAPRLADVPKIRISSSKVLPSLPTFQLVKPRSATSSQLPEFVEPMKAKLVGSMPSGDWINEIKFDGYRASALRGGSEARLLSRNQKDLGSKFPEVKDSIAALDIPDPAMFGPEIVFLTRNPSVVLFELVLTVATNCFIA